MKNKFGLKVKVLLLCTMLSLLTVIVGGIGYFSGQDVQSKYDSIVSEDIPKLSLVSDMYLTFRQVRISLRSLGLSGISKTDSDKALSDALELIAKFESAKDSYVKLGFEGKEKALFADMQKAWDDFKEVGARVEKAYKSGTAEDHKKMAEIFLKDCPEKAKVFGETIQSLTNFYRDGVQARTEKATADAKSSNLLTLFVIGLALLFGSGLGLWFSSATVSELKNIVTDLMGNANEVSGAVSDLTSSSEALSSTADQQSSAIQQTAASVEQIRSMVQRNSDSSIESAKLSAQSKDEAIQGQESVNQMIQAMQDIGKSNLHIQEEVESGNRRIAEIVNIIQEIESKTKVINEIVFQTKLLSFNASVESARAGEHGKGFAVVADEVGNLANMSGKAAQEISDMLAKSVGKVNEIVNETSVRVEKMMSESKLKVDHGSHVAQNCGEVLNRIVSNADELSRMVDSISSASKEQSQGVSEIAKAIQQLDSATQVNLVETKHTADSAQGLGEQVKSLNSSSYRLQVLINGGRNGSGSTVNTFVWKAQYALGVHAMDDEHKVLIEKINTLAQGINQQISNAEIVKLFSDLGAYTKKHFSDEEKYMESIRYPDLKNHKLIHKTLLAKLEEYGRKIGSGSFDSTELIGFLNDWLVKHIMGVDMKYANFSRKDAHHDHRAKAS